MADITEPWKGRYYDVMNSLYLIVGMCQITQFGDLFSVQNCLLVPIPTNAVGIATEGLEFESC